MMLFTNSRGQKDFLMTASALTLGVVLLKVLIAGVTVGKVDLGAPPDAALVAALLVPTLGSYTAKRIKVGP